MTFRISYFVDVLQINVDTLFIDAIQIYSPYLLHISTDYTNRFPWRYFIFHEWYFTRIHTVNCNKHTHTAFQSEPLYRAIRPYAHSACCFNRNLHTCIYAKSVTFFSVCILKRYTFFRIHRGCFAFNVEMSIIWVGALAISVC